MSAMRAPWTLAAPVILLTAILLALSTLPARAQTATAPPTALDATLYTTYTISSGDTNVSLLVCGSLPDSEGCYASAGMGPFGMAGALLEGTPTTKGSTVTRFIYVVDIAAGASGTDVELYVYKKTDTISSSDDTVAVTLMKTVSLPLTGGSAAVCSMAANAKFLFIGTNQGEQSVMVQKSDLRVTPVEYTGGVNVTSITTDQYGFVTVTQGDFTSGINGFTVFDPTGAAEGGGGGAEFMLSTTAGLSTATLPTSSVEVSEHLSVRPKTTKPPQK